MPAQNYPPRRGLVLPYASDPNRASNAPNFAAPVGYQVNPRTGTLQLSLAPPTIPGFLGTEATPSIQYNQDSAFLNRQVLGLPLGWLYAYSFILDNKVHINGKSSFYIDGGYSSGLRYYTIKDVRYIEYSKPQPLPYSTERQFISMLRFVNGDRQYFDENGRLLAIDDRFGNHCIFEYDRVANVTGCRVSRILDTFGRATVFSYPDGNIRIDYPQGAQNVIQVSMVLDDERYLVGYVDPLGQCTAIESRGGLVRHDLVSRITYPNGLEIRFDYGALKFSETGRSDVFRLDCVVGVHSTAAGVTRSVTYDYDPENNLHNFTGYPRFSVGGDSDTLLLSGDNDYRYKTRVDDGLVLTEHAYNRLHLELETVVYARSDNRVLSRVMHRFPGQKDGDEFPLYNDLRWSFPNYQAPALARTEIMNRSGESRSSIVETDFNEFGQMQEVRIYRSNKLPSPTELLSRQVTSYDYPTDSDANHYGLILQSDCYDYFQSANATSVFRRTMTSLTRDNKSVETTATGFVEAGRFAPTKERRFGYDSHGRTTFEELKWIDGQVHAPQASHKWTDYADESPVSSVASRNELGQKTVAEIDTATGWIICVTDALGSKSSYAYDNVGRRISQTDPLGVITRWTFDDLVGKETTHFANGYKIHAHRNGFGEEVAMTDNGAGSGERTLKTTGYNMLGQKLWEEGILGAASRVNYAYDDQGDLASSTDALGNLTRYDYDPAENSTTTWFNGFKLSKTVTNDEVTTTWTYSSRAGDDFVVTTSIKNGFDKVAETQLGTGQRGVTSRTRFEYGASLNLRRYVITGADGLVGEHRVDRDLFGNVRSETVATGLGPDAQGDTSIYNALNQLIEERNPLGQLTRHTYDAAGRQVTMTDYAGTTFSSRYRLNNQLESIGFIDEKGRHVEKRFVYDAQSEALTSVEEIVGDQSVGKIGRSYTLDGHLESVTYPDGSNVTIQYDLQHARVAQTIDVLGNATQYEYDNWGRLVQARAVSSGQLIQYEYFDKSEDPANSGRLKRSTINSSLRREYEYDGFGAVAKVSYLDTRENSHTELWSSELGYELPTMNMATVLTRVATGLSIPGRRIEYRYNGLNQLIRESSTNLSDNTTTVVDYEYDAANNVKREARTEPSGASLVTSYEYDADNKLIKLTDADGVVSRMGYDPNGNLVSDGRGGEYGYDLKGKLIRFKGSSTGPQWRYTYYANELRATKSVADGLPTKLFYDGDEVPSIVNEVAPGAEVSYVVANNSERPLRLVKTGDVLTKQHLITGTKDVAAVLDATLAVSTSYSYSAYGAQSNSSSSPDPQANPFQYARQYTDAESGLIYLRSRYYHPRLKRFITRDTATTLNRYGYGDGNPINGSDPTGEIFGIDDLLVALAVSAIIGAAVGATIGGVTTRSWKGALFGAVAGGVGGAVSFGVGTAITGGIAFGAGIAGIAIEEAPPVVGALIGAGTGLVSEAAGGAAGQAAANAIGDNGSVGQAALIGAAFGVVIGGATGYRATFRSSTTDFSSAPRGQRGRILDRISPRALNQIVHNSQTWRQIGREIRKPGGFHEWLVVEHFARFRAMGYTLEDIRSAALRTETDILELQQGGNWGPHGGPHPFINNAVGAARGPVSLNRAVRGISSRVRVTNGAGGYVQGIDALPSGFRSWLPPIGRMLRMPFSIAYGVQGRVWL